MNFKLLSLVAFSAFLFTSCNFQKKAKKSDVADSHTSQISLDWAGTYYGVLPCASCPGIETELTLTEDLNYSIEGKYLGNDEYEFSNNGVFSWSGNKIELEGMDENDSPWIYKVEENRIRRLDLNGDEITGDLASHYVLTKNGNPAVEDRRWQLVELNGAKVEGDPETHFIIFHSKEQRIQAKADCNELQFEYTIRNGLQLITEPGLSTMMACPGDLEQKLVETITLADNLSVSENSLTLNKGRMAPLARFELVE